MFSHCKLVILILALTLGGQVTREIYGGHEAVPHSRPYMVLLEQHMKDGRTKHCGGFLLNKDFVMTAAHCQADLYTVFLGAHHGPNSEEIQRVSAEEAFPHKDYDHNAPYLYFLLSLPVVKLKSKAHFNSYVRPIALADQGDGSMPKSCTVSGWGRSNRGSGYMTPTLMEANVTQIYHGQCPRDKLYCSDGETGPAEGDGGGPLVCEDGKAYGVVSVKYRLANGSPLQFYTKIPEYRNWIYWIMEAYVCISNIREL
ncbi:granzyme B(G,H)-like [Trachinotus anak]|uniref:granzyme B(G,H)-like n=1 Tax=Trachinotus anak TaxID=443729 RepID=UPI0039F225AD